MLWLVWQCVLRLLVAAMNGHGRTFALGIVGALIVGAIGSAFVINREMGEFTAALEQVAKNQRDTREETARFRTELREEMRELGGRILYLERRTPSTQRREPGP